MPEKLRLLDPNSPKVVFLKKCISSDECIDHLDLIITNINSCETRDTADRYARNVLNTLESAGVIECDYHDKSKKRIGMFFDGEEEYPSDSNALILKFSKNYVENSFKGARSENHIEMMIWYAFIDIINEVFANIKSLEFLEDIKSFEEKQVKHDKEDIELRQNFDKMDFNIEEEK